jgi:cytochrome c peroxidase
METGRVLFYDKNLSFNNSVSCASCHQPSASFATNQKVDKGAKGNLLKRNTPPILHQAGSLFWDGRVTSIEDLVLGPLSAHEEMMQDLSVLPGKLGAIAYYPPLFEKAFGTSEITLERIKKAIAFFCRTLTPGPTDFQNTIAFTPGSDLISKIKKAEGLTTKVKDGAVVFFTKGKCSTCHSVVNDGGTGGYGGTPPTAPTQPGSNFKDIGLDMNYEDKGLGAITKNSTDNGLFRLPTLLNLSYTAPYMHDGRYSTIEQVVEHYNSGILNTSNLSKELCDSTMLAQGKKQALKLGLNTYEKEALVEFLNSLQNTEAMKNVKNKNPFHN